MCALSIVSSIPKAMRRKSFSFMSVAHFQTVDEVMGQLRADLVPANEREHRRIVRRAVQEQSAAQRPFPNSAGLLSNAVAGSVRDRDDDLEPEQLGVTKAPVPDQANRLGRHAPACSGGADPVAK